MEIRYDDIILRDYRQSDIEDETRWMNEETAWMAADMPWKTVEPVDPTQLREEMMAMMTGMPENAIRWRLEIEKDGTHIGFVSSYFLGADYGPFDWENMTENTPRIRTLGIEICETAYWGQGIGTKALSAFMDYYRNHGKTRFALETWSGNARMLRCAHKLGFVEVKREHNAYRVTGQSYDALVLEGNWMVKVHFYEKTAVANENLKYAVIAAKYQGKWIFCRHKKRSTWEIPGGHRESGETALEAARRELYEETGATQFDLTEVCVYGVEGDNGVTYGMLCFAEVQNLGPLPREMEIGEISFCHNLPGELTYPEIQPCLYRHVQEWLNLQSSADE